MGPVASRILPVIDTTSNPHQDTAHEAYRQFAFPGRLAFVARTDDGRVPVGVDGADDDSRGTVVPGCLPRPLT